MSTVQLDGVNGRSKWRRVRGRPRFVWMDGVNVDFGRGMAVEAARQYVTQIQ